MRKKITNVTSKFLTTLMVVSMSVSMSAPVLAAETGLQSKGVIHYSDEVTINSDDFYYLETEIQKVGALTGKYGTNFNSSAHYLKDEVVFYGDKWYKAAKDNPSGTPGSSSDWEKIRTAEDELQELRELLGVSNAESYSSGETYDKGDVIKGSDGEMYQCQDDDTKGVDPVGDTTGKWRKIESAFDAISRIEVELRNEITALKDSNYTFEVVDNGDGTYCLDIKSPTP